MRTYERIIMLNIIDAQWKDHLLSLDHLKQGIGLVGYGQKDPLVEYKKQSFDMFQEMLDRIDTSTIRSLFNLQVVAEEPPEALRQRRMPRRSTPLTFTGPNQGAAPAGEEAGKTRPWSAINRKSAAMNPAPVAPERNTRSVTELRCKLGYERENQVRMPHYVSAFVLVSFFFLCLLVSPHHLPNTGGRTCCQRTEMTARAIETYQQGDATEAIKQLQQHSQKASGRRRRLVLSWARFQQPGIHRTFTAGI